jgi:hypothetical protein
MTLRPPLHAELPALYGEDDGLTAAARGRHGRPDEAADPRDRALEPELGDGTPSTAITRSRAVMPAASAPLMPSEGCSPSASAAGAMVLDGLLIPVEASWIR